MVAERFAPRDLFAGHQMNPPWDPLHRAYSTVRPYGPISALAFFSQWMACVWRKPSRGGRVRKLARTARIFLPARSRRIALIQDFFFGEDLMLRRHDYSVNIAGGFAAAQLTSDHVDANGIRLPASAEPTRVDPIAGPSWRC